MRKGLSGNIWYRRDLPGLLVLFHRDCADLIGIIGNGTGNAGTILHNPYQVTIVPIKR